jgi:hypothetical protein
LAVRERCVLDNSHQNRQQIGFRPEEIRFFQGFSRLAGLAQLVEHLICNQGVTGSSPVAGTTRFNASARFAGCLAAAGTTLSAIGDPAWENGVR